MRRTLARLLRIGDVVVGPRPSATPHLIPVVPAQLRPVLTSQWALAHLRFLAQKDVLGQHAMLMGPSYWARMLARRYAQMAGREVEHVLVTAETHEGDLKQRRELVDGRSVFVDEAVVRAAIAGRLLVLDGVQRAEQNVLPLLNSLLEGSEVRACARGRVAWEGAHVVVAQDDA